MPLQFSGRPDFLIKMHSRCGQIFPANSLFKAVLAQLGKIKNGLSFELYTKTKLYG